jgi:predicted enzyme related to lactoylglutathione lyase
LALNRLAYLELPARSTADMKAFYGTLFGWSFEDWGEDYTAFSDSGLDGGFHAGEEHRTRAPLAVIESDDIAAMVAQVRAAGGQITLPTFAFPGGRRFHFLDPAGNELAVMQLDGV